MLLFEKRVKKPYSAKYNYLAKYKEIDQKQGYFAEFADFRTNQD